VPSAAVDAVLARLQAQSSSATGVADLQAAVVAQLRSEHGRRPSWAADRDNLDLLRMLMQQVQQQQRPDPVPAALLARLQVPLARAAMADPGFFVRDEHPARELLNQMPKSAPTGWATMMSTRSCCSAWRRACRACWARMHAPEPSPPPTKTCSSTSARRPIAPNWPSAATWKPRAARNGWNWPVARPPHRSTSAATRGRHRASCRPCCARPGPMP
jgi:hypothetical protein